jgi:hypothetical protein
VAGESAAAPFSCRTSLGSVKLDCSYVLWNASLVTQCVLCVPVLALYYKCSLMLRAVEAAWCFGSYIRETAVITYLSVSISQLALTTVNLSVTCKFSDSDEDKRAVLSNVRASELSYCV